MTISVDEIVQLAWCDKTSFDAIERQTGLSEAEVIKVMRQHMKASSFRMWRARVAGRKAKHETKKHHNKMPVSYDDAQPE